MIVDDEYVGLAHGSSTPSAQRTSPLIRGAGPAFYDAVVQNTSALLGLGDGTLKEIARELAIAVRKSATLERRDKETVRAELQRRVKTLLKNRKYPDKPEAATNLVLEQATLFAEGILAA